MDHQRLSYSWTQAGKSGGKINGRFYDFISPTVLPGWIEREGADHGLQVDVERFTYDWMLMDFGEHFPSIRPKKDTSAGRIARLNPNERQANANGSSDIELISDPIICGQLVRRTSTWQLELRRKGGNLSIALCCLHCFHNEVKEIWTRFDTDIVDFNGNILYSDGGASYFNADNITKFVPHSKLGNRRDARIAGRNSLWETEVISISKLSQNWTKYVPRNVLNLRLKLYVYKEKPFNEASYVAEFQEPVKVCYTDASTSFQALRESNPFLQSVSGLWETMEGADVEIKIDEHLLKAHKLILTVQSPVLKTMVAEAEQTKSGDCSTIISLNGQNFEAFKLLLKYLYTQDAEEVKACKEVGFIEGVLKTCNHFDVQSLARICLVRLLTNMTVENFCETAFAVYRNVNSEPSYFKKEVKKFFMENQTELQASNDFKMHAKLNREHFLDICFEPIEIII